MENKKTLTTLLIILAVVLIASALYLFYFSKKDFSFGWLDFTKKPATSESQLQQINAAKRLTEQNIKDFVKNNKLDDLVDNPQYKELKDPNIIINIGQTGNSEPFTQNLPVETGVNL